MQQNSSIESQSTARVFMIRPVSFGYNEQTAESNAFQLAEFQHENVGAEASKEFDMLVNLLQSNQVDVSIIEDTTIPHTPDSIFPNNWISTHSDGAVFLYPMMAENRRAERRMDIVEKLRDKHRIERIHDLSFYEKEGKFLEGTGSLVLDRVNRIAYACLSIRTSMDPLKEFARIAGYKLVPFNALDDSGTPIYHTNVMMCMGEKFSVICLDAINELDKTNVVESLISAGMDIVQISMQQMKNFAGNMLQLKNEKNEDLLVMSRRAFRCLSQPQIAQLEKYCRIIHSPLDTIETNGGGSVRCMIAEIHLPVI